MINLVQICGQLKDDPELFDARSGATGAAFTVIVNNVRYDPSQGSPVLSPVFVRCVAWEDTAAAVARLGRGTVVMVTGQLTQQEVTTASGKAERKTKVHALTVQVVKTPLADRAPPPPDDDDQYPG